MRIAFTADLHLPITPLAKIAALAAELKAAGPDVVVVAGDVAESLADLERVLGLLRAHLQGPVLVLAGNHDLWTRAGQPISSRELWEVRIPETVRQAGCTWLEGQAFVQHGIAIAGTIAWYDYSAIDPAVEASPEACARLKRQYNPDGYRIDWPWTDLEFCALVRGPFLATLDRLEADAAVAQTVVVTHVPLLECQMCRRPHDPVWSFTNAYFGNLTLGREVLARRKVTHIVSGHTHVGREGRVAAADGRLVHARVLDSHYGQPRWHLLTLRS